MMDADCKSRIWLLAGAFALAAASAAQAQPRTAPDADIVPFKAVYKLDFSPSNDKSQVTGGQGRLTIEISGSRCTDYRATRSVNNAFNTRNGLVKIQSESTVAENAAGNQLTASFVERANGKATQQFSLVGRRNGDGSVTITSRDVPGGKANLPKGTLLPMQHELMINAAAIAGRKSITANVLNPEMSPTAVEQVIVSFGSENKTALPAGHPANIEALKTMPRQRAEVTFRDLKTGKVRALERMTRFTNGILTVSDSLTEHVKIKVTLGSLTMLPRPACS